MLEGTLRIYRDGNPMEMIPTLHMMAMPMEQLQERANRLNDMLNTIKDVNCAVVQVNSASGGGSLPGQQLPSFGVSLEIGSMSEVELERRLRQRDIPIISRIVENKVILDVRTLLDEDFQVIFDALQDIVSCV
jgi:L-seryl-tRNA(Ser) seleniumtransferase